MSEQWELVKLGLAECPGLALVVVPEAAGGKRPLLVAQPAGALVFAGALCDARGGVHQWLHLWFQDNSSWAELLGSPLGELDNVALDRRWQRWVEALERGCPGRVFWLGWEHENPPPIWLSADGGKVALPPGEWELCRDDAHLAAERLAPYRGSMCRYLWDVASQPRMLVPVGEGAPEGPTTRPLAKVFADLQAVNAAAGLAVAVRASELVLEDFVDHLSGRQPGGGLKSCLRVPAGGVRLSWVERAAAATRGSGMFFSRSQGSGHLGEVLHLKLAALRGAMQAVSEAVAATGTPHLALRADAFGVSVAEASDSLPFLWNHRVTLDAPPAAVRVEIGPTREPCFLVPGGSERSIYRSERFDSEARGEGRVRIRSVSAPDDDQLVIVEGTLETDENLRPGALDLLGLEWLSRKAGRLRVFAKFVTGQVNAGQYRFRSLPTRLPEELAAVAGQSELTLSTDRVAFHVMPRLGTPCDLYSLGVLGVRTLLADRSRPLSETLDDLLGLCRQYREKFGGGNWTTGAHSLEAFVEMEAAAGWRERLGPQRLTGSDRTADEAFSEIPAGLWWEVVEFLGRLFPGASAGSFCERLDDWNPRALQETFEEPLRCAMVLLERSRDLLFGNPAVNGELLGIVRARRAKGH